MPWSITLAKIGAAWLITAAAVGSYWLLERTRVLAFPEPPLVGIRTQPSDVVRLRKEHVPFAFLRRLGAHNDVYDIEITRHEVIIDDLPPRFDGYRIAFLTDTHVASFVRRDFYRQIVAQVQRFGPDAVLLGGDFVTWRRHIPLMAEVLLSDLRAPDGIFAILGNHDYWAGAEEVMKAMSAKGVQFITNRSVRLSRSGETLPLIGIDEIYRGTPDVMRAFEGIAPDGPCIAVSHHPDIIDLLGGRRIDLLVCGHTHGGQIRLPFFGALVVPSRHEGEFAAGFHRVGRVLMYVSRGIGAVPPVRILCRPELATFTLKRGHRTT
jgi:predicted MPP superfamily phosphohydrolase